jgi:hypothetical protein
LFSPSGDNVTEYTGGRSQPSKIQTPLKQRRLAGMNQDSKKTTFSYQHSNAAYAISFWLISYHFSLNRGRGALP